MSRSCSIIPTTPDAAQAAYKLFKKGGAEYAKRVRIEAAKYTEAPAGFVAGGGATRAEDDVIVLWRGETL